MDKKPLIVVSLCAVVLLVLGSLSNVVGYQTVQTSQQNNIKERINQRELLFQTIVDIANNKEIQRVILKSQISRGILPTSEIPVVTKNQLRQMYFIGLILSKIISKSKIQSMVQKYQLLNPYIQEGINGVIEKDVTLRNEITQIQNINCDCEKNTVGEKKSLIDYPFFKCLFLLSILFMTLIIWSPLTIIEDVLGFGALYWLLWLITFPIVYPISILFDIALNLYDKLECFYPESP